jgi:hypothetical protein
MASLTPSLRRRAVYAVLSPVLDEEALIAALWLQQDELRGDSVTDIIRFIDKVAQQHLLDAGTCRRLYQQLHGALRQPESGLPLDPLPLMQAAAPAASAVVRPGNWAASPMAPAAVASDLPSQLAAIPGPAVLRVQPPASALPMTEAVAVQPPASAALTAPAPAATLDLSDRPAVQVVHAGLMRAALSQVRQYHPAASEDLRSAALSQAARARVTGPVREAWRAAWEQESTTDWCIDAPQNALAELVNAFYVALCEALGPVDADHVLTRAVREAEGLPQAREFSPRRFV